MEDKPKERETVVGHLYIKERIRVPGGCPGSLHTTLDIKEPSQLLNIKFLFLFIRKTGCAVWSSYVHY